MVLFREYKDINYYNSKTETWKRLFVKKKIAGSSRRNHCGN